MTSYVDTDPVYHLTDRDRAEIRAEWAAIRSWDCDECGAPGGVLCTNSVTHRPMQHCPGHHSRMRKATA